MGRRPAYAPLRVYLNNRRVGTLSREASGAIGFSYHEDWLGWEHAQPALNARQIERKPMKMAMSVGNSRHYRFDQIHGRHFVQTAMRAGLSKKRATSIVEEIALLAPKALETSANALPKGFPMAVVDTVSEAVTDRVRGLKLTSAV
tara:strand:- start:1438 stop:1875 length:438 start_codon:yes stop_codon:yes gene_type:complete